jgi:hypothetical protein
VAYIAGSCPEITEVDVSRGPYKEANIAGVLTEKDFQRSVLTLSTQYTIQHARLTLAPNPAEWAHRPCNAASECKLIDCIMDITDAKSLGKNRKPNL